MSNYLTKCIIFEKKKHTETIGKRHGMKTIGRIYAVLLECFTARISAEEALEAIRKILMM